ncbi:hypothetical protein AALP_AAs39677U000100, partial [Arabis alpina]
KKGCDIKLKKDEVWQRIICGNKDTSLGDLGKQLKSAGDMADWRKLAIALILIVDGVLIGNLQINKPTQKYVRMLDDTDAFLNFPWGRESFLKTISTLRPPMLDIEKCVDPVEFFCSKLQQHSVWLQGFPLVRQLMAYKAIPLLLRNVPNANDGKTFMDASFVGILKLTTFAMSDILAVEHDPEGAAMMVGEEWDDEDWDKNVLYMEGQIRGLDVVDVDEKSAVVEHERHVVDRKATGEEVYESGKRVGKRKGRKLRSSRSKRKQQKIDNYFPPVAGFVDNKCYSSNGCADWCKEKKKDNKTVESAAGEEFGVDDIMDVADPPGVRAQADDVSRGHNMDLGPTHSSWDVAEHTPSDLVEEKLASNGDSADVGPKHDSVKEDRYLEEVLPIVESAKMVCKGKPANKGSDQESANEARELEEVRLAVNATVMGTIAMYSDKQEDKIVSAHGGVSLEEDGTPT